MADSHALVLNPLSYSRKSRMAVMCAITSRVHGWPFEVSVPAGLLPEKKGVGKVESAVVADAVRQGDHREREAAFVAEAPREVVDEVMDKLLAVLEEERPIAVRTYSDDDDEMPSLVVAGSNVRTLD
jgi:mRNA interferase MazF